MESSVRAIIRARNKAILMVFFMLANVAGATHRLVNELGGFSGTNWAATNWTTLTWVTAAVMLLVVGVRDLWHLLLMEDWEKRHKVVEKAITVK